MCIPSSVSPTTLAIMPPRPVLVGVLVGMAMRPVDPKVTTTPLMVVAGLP